MSAVPGVNAELASLLHGLGFSIFPVPMPRPGARTGEPGDGKTPAIPWKCWQTTRCEAAQLARWFDPPQNVAIVTGAVSGVIVVDCDDDESLAHATSHLPYTPWQVYTAKGFHLYYLHPGIPVRNRARITTSDGKIALDVRGDGGYVIGPWSEHASGAMYHAVGDWDAPIGSVPHFDPAWIATPPQARPATRPTRTLPNTPAIERARKYLAAIDLPQIGHGSDTATLYAAARLVRGFALSPDETVQLLDEWAGGRIGWDRHWLAQKVRHALRYGTEPIGGLL